MMLQLTLLILKIIGIVLLCLLGLFLLLLCFVLFVPVRYRIQAEWTAEPENRAVQAKITWLLHSVSAVFSYKESKFQQVIRILGIRLNLNKEKADDGREKKRKRKTKQSKRNENSDAEFDFSVEAGSNDGAEKSREIIESPISSEADESASEDEKQSFFSKCREFIEKLTDLFLNFKEKLRALFQKLADAKNNLDYYIEAFEDERNRQVIKLCLSQFGKIFKNIRPRKFRANIHVGMEDPASTGQLLAILGMIYPFFEGGLKVTPEFDEAVLEGSLFLKGRVTSFVLLRAAWRIYFNKDFRRMMRILKKEAV